MRYSEESAEAMPDQSDFAPRQRSSSIWTLILAYIVAILIIFLVSRYSENIGGNFVSVLIIILIVGALTFYTIFSKQRNLDLVMATEFQNALFANALSLGWKFVMFIKRDGTIVYANRGLRALFPEFAHDEYKALDTLLIEGNVDKDDSQKIFAALMRGVSDKLVVPIRTPQGEMRPMLLAIEPLERPAGFFVLRGREFVESRRAEGKKNPAGGNPLLYQLVEHAPMGLYAASASGELQYVNPKLEQMLGYEPNDILNQKLSLPDIIYQVEQRNIGEVELEDFTGEVLLQRRNGSLVKTDLRQELLRDDKGGVAGCIAYIHQRESGT